MPAELLFVHGAGGGAWEWRTWQTVATARGWPYRTIDLQAAADGLAQTRFRHYLDQVIETAPTNGVLVGASLGGLLALKAAEHVAAAALVLINPVPPAQTPGWPLRQPSGFGAIVPWSTTSLADTRKALPDADEETLEAIWQLWRDESGTVMAETYAGIEAHLERHVPTLVIIGGEDRDIPPTISTALAQRMGADIMSFAGVSHVGPLLGRRAAAIAALSLSWLETEAQ